MWASRVLKPEIQAAVYHVSRLLKVPDVCASPSPRTLPSPHASPSPCAPHYTDSSARADRSTQSKFRGRRSTTTTPKDGAEKPSTGIIDLTKAFGDSRLTDACERAKPSSQRSDSMEKPNESTFISRDATYTNAEEDLFGGSPSDKSTTTSPYTPRIRIRSVRQLNSQRRSNLIAENHSDRNSLSAMPSANFEVTDSPPDSSTANNDRSVPYAYNKEHLEFLIQKLRSLPSHGQQIMDQYKVDLCLCGLIAEDERQGWSLVTTFRTSDGTYRVPVIRILQFLEECFEDELKCGRG
jgi:hypothetical protein